MALLYLFGNHGQGAWLYMDNNYTWQLYGSAVFIWQPWPEGIAAMGRRVVGASSFLRGRAGLGVLVSVGGWGGAGVASQGGRSQSTTIGLPIPPPPLYIYIYTTNILYYSTHLNNNFYKTSTYSTSGSV